MKTGARDSFLEPSQCPRSSRTAEPRFRQLGTAFIAPCHAWGTSELAKHLAIFAQFGGASTPVQNGRCYQHVREEDEWNKGGRHRIIADMPETGQDGSWALPPGFARCKRI